ncbi:hypothetical protein [Henriciella pelagia]|jgi:hypothetical protein|uniref:Uncharacterized protein n=1 Tax=Henriciella pelagia TaxID=1977912 RepID=A0ABQ1J9N5_9PROT|nr:hypothetical protein [Henriciella pelagia]GGB63209.1 hypothetical protein GCM10011503_09890 [Henriciella pelagia]
MLFLLNDQIVDVDIPEMRLERRWRRMGCGKPHAFRAKDVVNFVHARLEQARFFVRGVDYQEACDLASLIIARTGANSLILRQAEDGSTEPQLKIIPHQVLEVYARGAANDEGSAPQIGTEPRRALS